MSENEDLIKRTESYISLYKLVELTDVNIDKETTLKLLTENLRETKGYIYTRLSDCTEILSMLSNRFVTAENVKAAKQEKQELEALIWDIEDIIGSDY